MNDRDRLVALLKQPPDIADAALVALLRGMSDRQRQGLDLDALVARAQYLEEQGHSDGWDDVARFMGSQDASALREQLRTLHGHQRQLGWTLALHGLGIPAVAVALLIYVSTWFGASGGAAAGQATMFERWLNERQQEAFTQMMQEEVEKWEKAKERDQTERFLEQLRNYVDNERQRPEDRRLMGEEPVVSAAHTRETVTREEAQQLFGQSLTRRAEPLDRDADVLVITPGRPLVCGANVLGGCPDVKLRRGQRQPEAWSRLETTLAPLVLDGRCAEAEVALKSELGGLGVREVGAYANQLWRLAHCYMDEDRPEDTERMGQEMLCVSWTHMADAYDRMSWAALMQYQDEGKTEAERLEAAKRGLEYINCLSLDVLVFDSIQRTRNPISVAYAYYTLGTHQWMALNYRKSDSDRYTPDDIKLAQAARKNLRLARSLYDSTSVDRTTSSSALVNLAEILVGLAPHGEKSDSERREVEFREIYRVAQSRSPDAQLSLELRAMFAAWLVRTGKPKEAAPLVEQILAERSRRQSATDSFDWTALERWMKLEDGGKLGKLNGQVQIIVDAVKWPPVADVEPRLEAVVEDLKAGG